jgi:hypothetical protein
MNKVAAQMDLIHMQTVIENLLKNDAAKSKQYKYLLEKIQKIKKEIL